MINFIKFELYIILLSILNFFAIKIMLINMIKIEPFRGLYYVRPYQYIIAMLLIIITKIIFDMKFHKIQKRLERKL